jgi:hypothetical protein
MPWPHARVLFFAVALLAANSGLLCAAEVETAHLRVSDASGRQSEAQLRERAARTQALFEKILGFWDADARVDRFGKIRVVFVAPSPRLRNSVFHWVREGGQMVREVLAASSGEDPQMLVHKLTSALYPNKDKLIRNMMGEVAELRLGNPRAFPDCGLSVDAWVLALRRLGLYLPLRELGPDHGSWGMDADQNGVPFILDLDRRHRAYAEAGSFGDFLFTAYGREKLKRLNQMTTEAGRPWQAVYGVALEELEARWLEALAAAQERLEPGVSLAAQLYRNDPATACAQAYARQPARP